MCCEGKKEVRKAAKGPAVNQREFHYHECSNPACPKPVFHRFGTKAKCPNEYSMLCPDCSKDKVPVFCNPSER